MAHPDFTEAADAASWQVVHIKVEISRQSYAPEGVMQGYDPREPRVGSAMASGSGVIISADGYIVTNNHVIENATAMQVILADKRTFKAKLIGRDPNTDLALIKIDATGLSAIKFGNSDRVQVGQWVLAIGFPFSLNTTVTAGIISAKERNIGLIGNKERQNDPNDRSSSNAGSAVEAYIQTDAAINPGNSGGALVNTSGELIGINAAIASQTGGYEGYGFAIPINLARKIIGDLKKYGVVKRGMLGVSFPAPATEDQVLRQKGIDPGTIKGVYLTGVQTGGAAAEAGLKEGDIIQKIDSLQVMSSVELSEKVARHHPNDQIKIIYSRGGKIATTEATLKAQAENTQPAKVGSSMEDIYNKLGAKFAPLDDRARQYFQLRAGMLVTAIARGGFFEQIGIQAGSIIVSINGSEVSNPIELNKALMGASNGIIHIACLTPDGLRVMFNISLGA
ncbi:trypsin-like peptidase domain-containing protein [Mucilaginibacter litoreus]|uniref:Trypsin-like peptidase domain-containing protein n=1 Tax=Mucilaginibacter litoreus TaxID=1048221 RepID=A0ABW3AWE6_9SPHI